MSSVQSCMFCRTDRGPYLLVNSDGVACDRCAMRLGMMLKDADPILFPIFPALREVEDEDEDEAEPTLRLADGTKVELRERTAELKKDLTMGQRAELTGTYVQIGLLREALLEAGTVLSSGAMPASERVLPIVFIEPLSAPDAIDRIRPLLMPV